MSEITGRLYEEQTSKQFYDERYSKGYMDEWPAEKRRRVFEVVRGLGLPDRGEALDFGCGSGVFTEVVRQALPGWKVCGTDLSAVALEQARRRVPGCEFFDLSADEAAGRRFDFLFTHHVLEHVYDLDEVWRQIAGLTKPASAMLHILPCGNEGSLEYRISRLVGGGFDPDSGGRFFFEDEGHLRRLDTEQMRAMAARAGFELACGYYSNQYHGAVNWITQNEPGYVSSLLDPARAVDAESGRELARLRRRLLPAALLRTLLRRGRAGGGGPRSAKGWAALVAGLCVYPASRLVDWRMTVKSEAEWRERKGDPGGSEMYLYFTRGR